MNSTVRWYFLFVFLVFTLFVSATQQSCAQVYQLTGGSSTMYNAQGGMFSMMTEHYGLSFGAGIVDGKFGAGGTAQMRTGKATYFLGDLQHTVSMPTDQFNYGRYLFMTGAGLKMHSKTTDSVFAGGWVADYYVNPLFTGAQPRKAAVIASMEKKMGEYWTAKANLVITRHQTVLGGLEWHPDKRTSAAITTGFSDTSPYGAVSLNLLRRVFDIKTEYVAYGRTRPLLNIATMQIGEPIKENVVIKWRPYRDLNIYGTRQNYLSFPRINVGANDKGVASETDSVSMAYSYQKFHFFASGRDANYQKKWNTAESVGVSRRIFKPLMLMTDYSASHTAGYPTQKIFNVMADENITPRWSVTQTFSDMNGNKNVNFGGSYFSNLFTVDVQYVTNYIPTLIDHPYKQGYSFGGTLNVFSRLKFFANSNMDAYGHAYYTAGMSLLSYGQTTLFNDEKISLGQYSVHGHVVTTDGRPADGIAVYLDKKLIVTDSDGYFEVNEAKRRSHTLKISPQDSNNLFGFDVITAPETVTSTDDTGDPGVSIVIKMSNKMKGMM